jgi:hypothetical protein
MNPSRLLPRNAWFSCLLVFVVLSSGAPAARADIGLESLHPASGKPGQKIDLSIGCGACLAVSVVQGPLHPPAALGVSLVPDPVAKNMIEADIARRGCNSALDAKGFSGVGCDVGRGPPRERPFTFLGWAKPAFRERDLPALVDPKHPYRSPKYRLSFRVPRVAPGSYGLTTYVGNWERGPRGRVLVDSYYPAPGPLRPVFRVRSAAPLGSSGGEATPGGDEAKPWLVTTATLLVAGLIALAIVARRSGRRVGLGRWGP